MRQAHRTLFITISLIFFLVGALHLLRFAFGLPLIIGGVEIPLWASLLAALILGPLSWRVAKLLE
ncbi:MAG: hypothetical protein Q8P45_01610 [Candidatus Harrisonbacteria bacterium]|nr:hypothetical protein [Candidatus Harrisonbacteria bacterium]